MVADIDLTPEEEQWVASVRGFYNSLDEKTLADLPENPEGDLGTLLAKQTGELVKETVHEQVILSSYFPQRLVRALGSSALEAVLPALDNNPYHLFLQIQTLLRSVNYAPDSDELSELMQRSSLMARYPKSAAGLGLKYPVPADFFNATENMLRVWWVEKKKFGEEIFSGLSWQRTSVQEQFAILRLLLELGVDSNNVAKIIADLNKLAVEQQKKLLTLDQAINQSFAEYSATVGLPGLVPTFNSFISEQHRLAFNEALSAAIVQCENGESYERLYQKEFQRLLPRLDAKRDDFTLALYQQRYRYLTEKGKRKLNEELLKTRNNELITKCFATALDEKAKLLPSFKTPMTATERLAYGREQRSLASKLGFVASYTVGLITMALGVTLLFVGTSTLPFLGSGAALMPAGIALLSLGGALCAGTGIVHAVSDYLKWSGSFEELCAGDALLFPAEPEVTSPQASSSNLEVEFPNKQPECYEKRTDERIRADVKPILKTPTSMLSLRGLFGHKTTDDASPKAVRFDGGVDPKGLQPEEVGAPSAISVSSGGS